MVDLKKIIREMLAKGFSEEEIKQNLADLGVEDPARVFKEATEQMKPMAIAPQKGEEKGEEEAEEEEGKPPATLFAPAVKPAAGKAEPEEEEKGVETLFGEEKILKEESVESEAEAAVFSKGADEKLDDAIALLKSLQDINKKILETNRAVLLRLQK